MRGGIRVTANLDYEVEHNISTELRGKEGFRCLCFLMPKEAMLY